MFENYSDEDLKKAIKHCDTILHSESKLLNKIWGYTSVIGLLLFFGAVGNIFMYGVNITTGVILGFGGICAYSVYKREKELKYYSELAQNVRNEMGRRGIY